MAVVSKKPEDAVQLGYRPIAECEAFSAEAIDTVRHDRPPHAAICLARRPAHKVVDDAPMNLRG